LLNAGVAQLFQKEEKEEKKEEPVVEEKDEVK